MIIASMATFPKRKEGLVNVIEALLPQVDRLNICLNEYNEIPSFLIRDKVHAFIPPKDYRDVGKFLIYDFDRQDDIFYVDDDIIYPPNYVEKMKAAWEEYSEISPIIGVHGVIYPDLYDGLVKNRKVYSFRKSLDRPKIVNQLGTGTVFCKGYQAVNLDFMSGSERYVDVRFARWAIGNKWPMICIDRDELWLGEKNYEESIFSSFTREWPLEVIRECQSISGYGKMDINAIIKVETLN